MSESTKQSGLAQFQKELTRLEQVVEAEGKPDLVDVAVLTALKHAMVMELMKPVLESGGYLKATIIQPAGTVAGIVQFDFELAWDEGTSHTSAPPVIAAIVELQPPTVVKVVQNEGAPSAIVGPLTQASGLIPIGLSRLAAPSTDTALRMRMSETKAVVEFLNREKLNNLLEEVNGLNNADTGVYGSSSGSACSSLLCFERHSDDFDDPAGKIGGFTTRSHDPI